METKIYVQGTVINSKGKKWEKRGKEAESKNKKTLRNQEKKQYEREEILKGNEETGMEATKEQYKRRMNSMGIKERSWKEAGVKKHGKELMKGTKGKEKSKK